MMENASLFLAGVDGIDAVFTGHQHLVFPEAKDFQGLDGVDLDKGTLMGKPAVMAGFWGSHMGLIDLLLERDGSSWKVVSATSEARPIYERDRQPERNADRRGRRRDRRGACKADHEATLAYVRRPVGKTVGAALFLFRAGRRRSVGADRLQAQTWYIKEHAEGHASGRICRCFRRRRPFKAGGRGGPDYYTDVPAGDIAIKNVADLYLYPNTVRARGSHRRRR